MKYIIFLLIIGVTEILTEDSTDAESRRCTTLKGEPQMCYPPFENYASASKRVVATNTCGLRERQKYCIGLSSAEMRSRCAYCDDRNIFERHSASFLTDNNPNNWWQSETLAQNKDIHYKDSINITLDLGKQFHVAFIHLQFKSPRPRAMVIYRKFNDDAPWTPWQYFASNCEVYFKMPNQYVADRSTQSRSSKKHNEVFCTEEFSSANDFYNGIVLFSTIYGRAGANNFFSNQALMDWTTASQIRIELRKMFTFGDQIAEEELLLTHFLAIKSLQVAGRCWCNGHGNECRKSTGPGLEPKMYCVCDPSHFTEGQSCEKCQKFYQDRPWKPANANEANPCKKCECNGNSDSCLFDSKVYEKSGNKSGGVCINCRGNTKGVHCEECETGFYKQFIPITSRDSSDKLWQCVPCSCDPTGSASNQCDATGKCVCLAGVEGEKCSRCKGDHYNFGRLGCQPCSCNEAGINSTNSLKCSPGTGNCYCKRNVNGEKCDKCLQGYFSLSRDDPLGCRPCFCYAHTRECAGAKGYLVDKIESTFVKTVDNWYYQAEGGPKYSPMLDLSQKEPAITWFQNRDPFKNNYFLFAPIKFIGNRQMSYNLVLELLLSFRGVPGFKGVSNKMMTMTTDVQLVGDILSVSVPFDVGHNTQPVIDEAPRIYRYLLNEESGGWRDKQNQYRFNSILSNLTALKIRLSNSDGYVQVHRVTLQQAIPADSVTKEMASKLPEATSVEQCKCPSQYHGLSCDQCAPGYHRETPRGTPFVKCVKCQCNNQADTCDSVTGKCHCQNNTMGFNCEFCKVGYYGDPTTKQSNVCKPCGCPGNTSCQLVNSEVVCTDCPNNLSGPKCMRCQDGYYGNPEKNIPCKQCNCHGNIGYLDTCDKITGKCSNCLYNSDGDYCESCLPGYYIGKPTKRAPYRCEVCKCNIGGSKLGSICDGTGGNCFCKDNVIGRNCNQCKVGYFNITAEPPCEKCNCFPPGSINASCNLETGQCHCRPGVTGLRCDRCQDNYFNLTAGIGCEACHCNPIGSKQLQCHPISGKCDCKPNVIGQKCDGCKVNFFNLSANCQECPPCYGVIQKKVESLSKSVWDLSQMNMSANFSEIWNSDQLKNWANSTLEELNELKINIINNINNLNNAKREFTKAIKDYTILQKTSDIDAAKKKIDDKFKEIEDIEKQLPKLIEEAEAKLKLLQKFIIGKSANENLTKVAREAQKIIKNLESKQLDYIRAVTDVENSLKDSEDSFLNFIIEQQNLFKKYDSFKSDSKRMDELFKNVDENVALKDFADINALNKKMKELLKTLTDANKEYDEMMAKFDDFPKMNTVQDLQRMKTLIVTVEAKNQKLKDILKDLKTEAELLKSTNPEVTKLQALLQKLEDTDKSVKSTIDKAETLLKNLNDMEKNFNKVVSETEKEANINLQKLPELKKQYNELEKKIRTNLLPGIQKTQTETEELLKQYQMLEDILSKFNLLKLSTLSDELKVNKLSDDKQQQKNDADKLKNEFLKEQIQINQLVTTDQKQKDQIQKLDSKVDDLKNQLEKIALNMGSNTNTNTNLKLTEKIEKITKEFDDYSSNEEKFILNEIKEIDENINLLKKDSMNMDSEIERLTKIDKLLAGKPTCYKTGGRAEGD